jgi:hypothetical protein
VTFWLWYVYGSSDPHLWLTDFCLLLTFTIVHYSSKIISHREDTKQ